MKMIEEKIRQFNEDVTSGKYGSPAASGKKVYTVPEIQDILDIGRASAYRLVKSGQFKTIQIGGAIRVLKDSFDEWLDGIEEGKAGGDIGIDLQAER